MTNDDPLTRLRSLRTEGAADALPTVSPAEKQPYEAFKAVNRRQLRLRVRGALNGGKFGMAERLTYSYLHRIVEDDDRGEQIGLVYQFAVVIIRGRNLTQVAEAIDEERCAWIRSFDPRKFEKPDNPAAPFIESIHIYVEREQMLKEHDALLQRIDLAGG